MTRDGGQSGEWRIDGFLRFFIVVLTSDVLWHLSRKPQLRFY
jgi:hypothetical protein